MGMHLLRRHVLRELHGRLWHMTPPDRFEKILEIGSILPFPKIRIPMVG